MVAVEVPVVTARADTVAAKVDSVVVRARRVVALQAASTLSSVASSVVDSVVAVVLLLLRPRRTVDGVMPPLPASSRLSRVDGQTTALLRLPLLRLPRLEAGKKIDDDAKCGIAWRILG